MKAKDNHIDYTKESILIVDDDLKIGENFESLLSLKLGINTSSTSNGPDALEMLKENKFSFIMVDMQMPKMNGMELIELVSDIFPDISIIAITGHPEYRYIDVIDAGASDFIKKPVMMDELEAKLRRLINERNLRLELGRLSITDSLTGLYNQRHFYLRLDEEIMRANRQKRSLGLILLDLDNFKDFNDTLGHLAGDDVLQKVGQIINKNIREGVDSGYRYGGDEFAIILIDAGIPIASEIAGRINKELKEKAGITASIGFSKFTRKMRAKELVALADKELYTDKQKKGKN